MVVDAGATFTIVGAPSVAFVDTVTIVDADVVVVDAGVAPAVAADAATATSVDDIVIVAIVAHGALTYHPVPTF